MSQDIYDELESYARYLRKKLDSPDLNDKEKAAIHDQYMETIDRIHTIHHSEMEFCDKSNRTDLEERKVELMAEIERLKAKFDWKKASVEMAKVIVPMIGSSAVLIAGLRTSYQIETNDRITNKFSNIVFGQIPRVCK